MERRKSSARSASLFADSTEQTQYGAGCLSEARAALVKLIGLFELVVVDHDEEDVSAFRQTAAGLSTNLYGIEAALDLAPAVAPKPNARRIAVHPASDARQRRAAEYAAVCDEDMRVKLSDRSLAGVLAHAVGSCENDPLLALLQEIERRIRTLRAASTADAEVALSDDDFDMELYMLELRAETAQELLTRGWTFAANSSERPSSSSVIDQAAEE
jgi:hypothetical protein